MATDLSSGENGSASADRNSIIEAHGGIIPTVEPLSATAPSPMGLGQPAAAALPEAAPVVSQPIVVTPETQAKAEAAARIAAQSLGAPNLTKELAQLLAASFAQSQMLPDGLPAGESPATTKAIVLPQQPAAVPASGTPTNAELASLSAIMAGTQTVRKPLPRFRDELATLNYTRAPVQAEQSAAPSAAQPILVPGQQASRFAAPAAQPAPAASPYPSQAVASFEPHHDDEPMPIPSTWREKSRHDEDRPFMRQLGAALMGLAAGLLVIVPAVLWLTGVIGPQGKRGDVVASRASERPVAKVRPIEPPLDSATFYSSDTPGSVAADPGPVTTASMARVASPVPVDPSQQIEQVLVLARQKIDGGDVTGARDLLSGEDMGQAAIAFALAETFDPNMLAAWGSRGVSADVQRARALYGRALDLGFGRALARLDALR